MKFTDKQLKQAANIKARIQAFDAYQEGGIKQVEKYWPDQVAFMLKNKDKTYVEIVEMVNQDLANL